MTTRIVIADDQDDVRGGFRIILDAQPDMRVVGEAADGVAAVELARRLRPDVVLADIRMPRMDGLEVTRLLAGPSVPDPLRADAPGGGRPCRRGGGRAHQTHDHHQAPPRPRADDGRLTGREIGGRDPRRAGPHQRGDRRRAVHHARHGRDPRREHPAQAGRNRVEIAAWAW